MSWIKDSIDTLIKNKGAESHNDLGITITYSDFVIEDKRYLFLVVFHGNDTEYLFSAEKSIWKKFEWNNIVSPRNRAFYILSRDEFSEDIKGLNDFYQTPEIFINEHIEDGAVTDFKTISLSYEYNKKLSWKFSLDYNTEKHYLNLVCDGAWTLTEQKGNNIEHTQVQDLAKKIATIIQ